MYLVSLYNGISFQVMEVFVVIIYIFAFWGDRSLRGCCISLHGRYMAICDRGRCRGEPYLSLCLKVDYYRFEKLPIIH